MTVVVDPSFVIALGHAGDANHDAARGWIADLDEDLVTSPLALAELDRIVCRYLGDPGREALRRDLDSGVYAVRWWADALDETLAIARRQPGVDLTRASLIALAQRLNTTRIATFDPRYDGTSLPDGRPLLALPADR